MLPNVKINELMASLDYFAPVSQGIATVTTPSWIYVGNLQALQAKIMTGVMSATSTVTVNVQQATSSGGAGAKNITGKTLSLTQAGGNSGQINTIDFRPQDLDTNNGFCYVQINAVVAAAASLLAMELLGEARFEAVNAAGASLNAAAVGTQV
jgi:hypothetical protein